MEKFTQVQEVQGVPIKINPKKLTRKHIIIEKAKVKDRETLKSSKRETVSYLQGSFHKAVS